MNAREILANVAHWLGYQDEHLSSGLKSSFDALRLYEYAQANAAALPEMADEWEDGDFVKAIGYNPFSEGRDHCEPTDTPIGALQVQGVLMQSRALLDSVAFVATEGDTKPVIEAIDALLSH